MSEVSEELRETAVYNTILTGLAEGRNTLQELSFAYRIFQSENQCVLKESDGAGISGKGIFF